MWQLTKVIFVWFLHDECCCYATSIQVMATADVWEFPSHDSQLLCAGTLSDTELHRTKSPLLSSSATQIQQGYSLECFRQEWVIIQRIFVRADKEADVHSSKIHQFHLKCLLTVGRILAKTRICSSKLICSICIWQPGLIIKS